MGNPRNLTWVQVTGKYFRPASRVWSRAGINEARSNESNKLNESNALRFYSVTGRTARPW